MNCNIFLLVMLFFISCQLPKPKSIEPDVSATKDSIENVFMAWSDQFEQLNVEGVMDYMTADDELTWVVDGYIIRGRNNISVWMKEALSPIQNMNYVKYGDATITILGLDAAVHIVDFEESLTFSSGDTIIIRGVWMNVFKLIDGKWKVIHSATSYLADQ